MGEDERARMGDKRREIAPPSKKTADSKGGDGVGRPYASAFFQEDAFLPYKTLIVHCVHLQQC